MDIKKMIDEVKQERKADKERYKNLDDDLCMLCHAYGTDKRSLTIDCFYQIKEVVPEAIDMHLLENDKGYYLRICKSCRGELLGLLKTWRDNCISRRGIAKDHDGCPEEWVTADANIPVRINGAVVMMTEENYTEYKENK